MVQDAPEICERAIGTMITQGSSDVNDELIAQDIPDVCDDPMGRTDFLALPGRETSSDDSGPIPKRLRPIDETKRFRPCEEDGVDTLIQVSRRERATLLREFQRGQRIARKLYKANIRALWDAELADDKENGGSAPGEDVESEVEAEAFEDYLFAKMMRYDGD
jgi:hypothetical protein